MEEAADEELIARTEALLEPGEVALNGLIVGTEFGPDDESAMHAATVEIGGIVAERAGADADDWYVHSGNDDSRFGTNQHQGRTIDDDGFVWECQQLLREGSFDLVFYYRADADHAGIVEAVREAGYRATGVEVG